ncbi:ZZ type zinc finger domain-containing protein [Balamuthia mandrillaris]
MEKSLLDSEHVDLFQCDHRAICDGCDFPIFGIRYKCLHCEDYDFCDYCEQHTAQLHFPLHLFAKIRIPLPSPEDRPPMRLSPLPSSLPLTDDYPHRGVLCHSCRSPIFDVRYKCLQCDKDVSYCSACEASLASAPSSSTHPPTHVFLKLYDPLPSQLWPSLHLDALYPEEAPQQSRVPLAIEASSDRSPTQTFTASHHHHSNEREVEETVSIEPMQANDLQQVLKVERESFSTPYDEDYFLSLIHSRFHWAYVAVVHPSSSASTSERRGIDKEVEEDQSEERRMKQKKKTENTKEKQKERDYSNEQRMKRKEKLEEREDEEEEEQEQEETCKNRTIGGYILFSASLKWLRVLSIAVAKEHRQKGLGERLLRTALRTGVKLRCSSATLHVNVFNLPAQRLYQKYGFQAVNWVYDYYSDERDDAIKMQVPLSTFSLKELT